MRHEVKHPPNLKAAPIYSSPLLSKISFSKPTVILKCTGNGSSHLRLFFQIFPDVIKPFVQGTLFLTFLPFCPSLTVLIILLSFFNIFVQSSEWKSIVQLKYYQVCLSPLQNNGDLEPKKQRDLILLSIDRGGIRCKGRGISSTFFSLIERLRQMNMYKYARRMIKKFARHSRAWSR